MISDGQHLFLTGGGAIRSAYEPKTRAAMSKQSAPRSKGEAASTKAEASRKGGSN